MQLGWVDYSREERETIKELLKVLGESGSLDELGVGIVRDSISDLLYPGTSVLHTRAKYYILIPELFKNAMKSGLTTGAALRRRLHLMALHLMIYLQVICRKYYAIILNLP